MLKYKAGGTLLKQLLILVVLVPRESKPRWISVPVMHVCFLNSPSQAEAVPACGPCTLRHGVWCQAALEKAISIRRPGL